MTSGKKAKAARKLRGQTTPHRIVDEIAEMYAAPAGTPAPTGQPPAAPWTPISPSHYLTGEELKELAPGLPPYTDEEELIRSLTMRALFTPDETDPTKPIEKFPVHWSRETLLARVNRNINPEWVPA